MEEETEGEMEGEDICQCPRDYRILLGQEDIVREHEAHSTHPHTHTHTHTHTYTHTHTHLHTHTPTHPLTL